MLFITLPLSLLISSKLVPKHSNSATTVGTVPMFFVTPKGHSGDFPVTDSCCGAVAQNCGPWYRLGVMSLGVMVLVAA